MSAGEPPSEDFRYEPEPREEQPPTGPLAGYSREAGTEPSQPPLGSAYPLMPVVLVKRPTNTLAITALVLGIVCFIIFLGFGPIIH